MAIEAGSNEEKVLGFAIFMSKGAMGKASAEFLYNGMTLFGLCQALWWLFGCDVDDAVCAADTLGWYCQPASEGACNCRSWPFGAIIQMVWNFILFVAWRFLTLFIENMLPEDHQEDGIWHAVAIMSKITAPITVVTEALFEKTLGRFVDEKAEEAFSDMEARDEE